MTRSSSAAAAELGGAGEQHRARIGAGEGDAQIRELAFVLPQRDGDAGDRIFDRAADADLVVGRAQTGRVFRAHGGDELARAQREIIFAVALGLGDRHVLAGKADIERLERNGALAGGAGDVDLGAERQQRGGKIAGEGRKADAAALRRDVADGAGGLQAMIVGVTPPFALVIEDAARVEAEIAADRAHVALGGAGDMRGRLRDHGIMLVDRGMRGDLAQASPRRRARSIFRRHESRAAPARGSCRSEPAARRCRGGC